MPARSDAAAAGGRMPHHQALEMLAASALAAGDTGAAFELADRRCRIRPAPEAHSFVIRADSHFHLGRKRFAVADLRRALAIAPEDIATNRRMLAWADGRQQAAAAAALLPVDRDPGTLLAAMDVLERHGRRRFAALQVFERTVRGWVAWHGPGPVLVTLASLDQSTSHYVQPDPFHSLCRGPRQAATFEVPRSPSAEPQTIYVAIDGETCLSFGAPANDRPASDLSPAPASAADSGVTVIVPVYADYQATRACLDLLVAELERSGRHRAVLVNDASPDPRTAPYLRRLATKPSVSLLTNDRNVGFVASVNRALAATRTGDVILLNADTVPPPGFIDRLAKSARSAPGIGAVTPLSNDAEFTSFPIPGRANPPGTVADVIALDRIAAEVNAGTRIDIPSGTGFCLYLTRSCLDAIGHLSATFHRGYLEDVELCLRARARGYRTVCDPSIFVGHVGSRSFGAEKSALALRNFAILDQAHPGYSRECAAYAAADPLRLSRAAIERRLPPAARPSRLLVSGRGAVGTVARSRADALVASGQDVLLATTGPGMRVVLADHAGCVPQSLAFDLSVPAERGSFTAGIRHLAPREIELLDPANIHADLLAALLALDLPYDLFVANAGLFFPGGEGFGPAHLSAQTPARVAAWRERWDAAIIGARQILAPSVEAEAFARRFLKPREAAKLHILGTAAAQARRTRSPKGTPRLGIVPVSAGPATRDLVGRIALALRDIGADASIVVLGSVTDEIALTRFGNVTVTGAVAPSEVQVLIRHYRITRLLCERASPVFGHPLFTAARQASLPTAYRDWSDGMSPPASTDLAIRPFATHGDIARALAQWMT